MFSRDAIPSLKRVCGEFDIEQHLIHNKLASGRHMDLHEAEVLGEAESIRFR
jgi:hypothetical protein